MSLVLKINTVDRSNHVSWETLVKTEVLTKEVDRMDFTILKTPSKTIPAIGDDVVLEEDSVKIFGGVIVEMNEIVKGGVLLAYEVKCKDYAQYLDRKLVTKSYENQTARAIVLDIISTFTSGFTTSNVATSTPTVKSIKFNYEQVSRCLTQLADQIGWDWYVDYNKDIHFFESESQMAPFSLTDTNDKFQWNSLELNRTILQLKNSIFVRGGEYKKTIAEGDAIDKYKATSGQKTFALAYRYDNITVKKNGSVQTIGTDQQTDPGTVNLLYNFNEKFITFSTGLSSGDDVVVYGDAFIPIIAQARDQLSIAAYGAYETAVVDKSITSVDEAQTRAKTELKKYAESVFEGSFKTTQTGLIVGQRISINSSLRGINKSFKINRIVGKARGGSKMEYTIFLIASGQVSFTDIMVDLLEKDKKNIVIADNEVLQRIEIFLDSLSLSDSLATPTHTSPPYKWGPDANALVWDKGTWG